MTYIAQHRLAVIDPEDAEQVARLAALYAKWGNLTPDGGWDLTRQRDLAAALREYATPPPRVEEPTGRYAAIEDADGTEWVRIDGRQGFSWQRIGAPSMERNAYASWDGLAQPVRVLSTGVEADR